MNGYGGGDPLTILLDGLQGRDPLSAEVEGVETDTPVAGDERAPEDVPEYPGDVTGLPDAIRSEMLRGLAEIEALLFRYVDGHV